MCCYPDYTTVQAILARNLPVLRVACSVGHSQHAHFATNHHTSWLIMNMAQKSPKIGAVTYCKNSAKGLEYASVERAWQKLLLEVIV